MPMLKRPDGEIYYQEYGQGYPILLFAPGGMRSRSDNWHSPADGPPRNFSDWTQSLVDGYRVIAMDQRNAGRSRTAIEADRTVHLVGDFRRQRRGVADARLGDRDEKLLHRGIVE